MRKQPLMMHQVIAIDLGAESGRALQVAYDGQALAMRAIHRFPNVAVSVRGTLYWDVLRLWHDIQEGIARLRTESLSVGVDSWGVDFALLDAQGELLANPVHYRDSGKHGAMEWAFERVPRRTIFERTGIQFIVLNGLYQLAHMRRSASPLLDQVGTAFCIADLFHYWLSGQRVSEFTIATTTQCYDPRAQAWDTTTAEALGLPAQAFPAVVQPGTRLGNYEGLPVIAPCSHDTASAVVAVPSNHPNIAYISSGTWSLVGMETDAPIITEEAYQANVTSEGGYGGTFRLLKNVMGLWLAQQCRAAWRAAGQDYSYEDLAQAAEAAAPFLAFIEPDDIRFLPPGDMPAHIRQFCRETEQPEPQSIGQVMRIVYESLALKYRHVIDQLRHLAKRPIQQIHIIGGGAHNALLCQMTANATACPVIAGPVEATALGNGIIQLISLGVLRDVAQARHILSQDSALLVYTPRDTQAWQAAYERFQPFAGRNSYAPNS